MATNNAELIDEVRSLTGYTDHMFSDVEMHSLLQLSKEEIRSDLGDPNFTFYQTGDAQNTHEADRALFWFLCIATKVRAGEIGGGNVSVSDLDFETVEDDEASIWIRNYHKRINSVGVGGKAPARVDIDRGTERNYGNER